MFLYECIGPLRFYISQEVYERKIEDILTLCPDDKRREKSAEETSTLLRQLACISRTPNKSLLRVYVHDEYNRTLI
jgi:hypothetical protein